MASKHGRRIGVGAFMGIWLAVVLALAAPIRAQANCDSKAAKALRSDARNAKLWTYSWAGIYAAGSIGQYFVAKELVDDEDVSLNLYVGAIKSGLGVVGQFLFPMRIESPSEGCTELETLLEGAKRAEDKKRGWFPHTSLVFVNLVGSAYVYHETDNLRLTIMGSVIGATIGEIAIFTTPNKVRSGNFANGSMSFVPNLSDGMRGLSLVGHF